MGVAISLHKPREFESGLNIYILHTGGKLNYIEKTDNL